MSEKRTTLGEKIAAGRKELGFTQEQLAEKIGVSAQAVSKWENNVTSPDISILPVLARFFKTTVDYLLDESVSVYKPKSDVRCFTAQADFNVDDSDGNDNNYDGNSCGKKKSSSSKKAVKGNLSVRIIVQSDDENVNVSVPYLLLKTALKMGLSIPSVSENLEGIDVNTIFKCVEDGVIGKILDVDSGDAKVKIYLENH